MADVISLANISLAPSEFQNLISDINSLITIFQAIGGIFVVWIAFSLIRMYFLRKRTKAIEEIRKDVKDLKKEIIKLKKRK